MFLMLKIALFGLYATCASAQIANNLVNFAQHAVPAGEIRYRNSFTAADSIYHLFTLQQAERRGVLLVRQISQTRFEIVDADTSFDFLVKERNPSESATAIETAARLLEGEHKEHPTECATASPHDTCPLGASLNELLIPIAGFALTSNSTLGILRDLRRAAAYIIDPERAPPGSILVSPSHFATQGPVVIGFAVIVGPDRCVYGPDYRQGGAWRRIATLGDWLRLNQSVATVCGFLLRSNASTSNKAGTVLESR
jgi:hypothetical protein